MSVKSIFIAILCVPMISVAYAEDDALPQACHEMIGSHAVVDLLQSANFRELIDVFIDPDYVAGNPAFTLAIKDNAITSTGAVSGNVSQMKLYNVNSPNVFFEYFGGKTKCSLRWNDNLSLTRVDLSTSTVEQLTDLSEYLAHGWKEQVAVEELQKIEEFMLYEFSMIGVTGGAFGLPMKRIAP
ncbi:hypothetical protein [Stenoxybacter acetivorans]|uniref:hypothetical protein n=1 Tax=Stenoxybacter acetivorans TaxID=422441 RepID=UPI00056CF466|nr:hypothetical protein [Stenoxybacter acetivorans]